MSVTNKPQSPLKHSGREIASKEFSSILEKSAFMQYRSKPIPALFSRKALNLEYTFESLFKPVKEMNITENNGFGAASSFRQTDMLKTLETNFGADQLGTTGMTIRYGSSNPTTRALKQPRKQG